MKAFIILFFALLPVTHFVHLSAQSKSQTTSVKHTVAGNSVKQKDFVNKALLKARVYRSKDQWNEAGNAYDSAIQYDNTNFDVYLEFVSVFRDRDYHLVTTVTERILPVYEKLGNTNPASKRNYAVLLECIGEAYKSRGEGKLKEALAILSQLYQKDPRRYGLDVARVQKKLGLCFLQKGEYADAETWLNMSLTTVGRLQQKEPMLAVCDLAAINISLAAAYLEMDSVENAKRYYESALHVQDTCKSDPLNRHYDYIPRAKRGLARIALKMKDSSAAKMLYKEVYDFYAEKYALNGKLYVEQATSSLEEWLNITYRAVSTQSFYWTEKLFNYRLSYYKLYDLEKEYESLAGIYSHFGYSCMAIRNFKRADTVYSQALELYRKVSPFAEDYKTDVAEAFHQVAVVNDSLDDYKNAEQYRLESLSVCESLNEDTTKSAVDLCAFLESDLLDFYLIQAHRKNDSAFGKFSNRVTMLYDRLQKTCAGSADVFIWPSCNAGICGSLSYFLLFLKKFPEAAAVGKLGLERDGSQTWIKTNIAHALLFQGKYDEAEKIYRELKSALTDIRFDYVQDLLDDLDKLETFGITNPDVAKIRKLLHE